VKRSAHRDVGARSAVDRRARLFRLVTAAAVLVGALAGVELLLRIVGVPRYGRSFPGERHPSTAVAAYVEPDGDLGWVSNRSMPGVNAQGFRDPRDLVEPLDDGSQMVRVMMLGDSFVWGVGVGPDATIPRLLEGELGEDYQVFSLAVPGWGVDQMYLAYRRYARVLDPRQVIVVFIDDDVDRVLEAWRPWEGLAKPCLVVRDDRLLPRVSSGWWERNANKLLWRSALLGNLLRQVFLSSDAVPVVRHAFAAMAAEAADHGRSLTLVRIPLRDGRKRRPSILAVDRFAGSQDVKTLEAVDWMEATATWKDRLYLEDGHLSPEGNRLIAQRLAREVLGEESAGSGR